MTTWQSQWFLIISLIGTIKMDSIGENNEKGGTYYGHHHLYFKI